MLLFSNTRLINFKSISTTSTRIQHQHQNQNQLYQKTLINNRKLWFSNSSTSFNINQQQQQEQQHDVNQSRLPFVFFKVSASGKELGTITFKLYDEKVPKTSLNFYNLSIGHNTTNTTTTNTGTNSYKGSTFHRVIPSFMIQGGDFENHNGTGGTSIYGSKFPDENFLYNHSKPGLLSMANSGPNTNGSQFFITTAVTSWLDGKHVVFGEVVDGFEVVKKIESLGTQSGQPKSKIVIEDCGAVSP